MLLKIAMTYSYGQVKAGTPPPDEHVRAGPPNKQVWACTSLPPPYYLLI